MYGRVALLGLLTALPLALCADPVPPQAPARPVYKSPLGLAVDHAGKHAYVALHSAGTVAVVDLEAGKVLAEIPVGRGPYDLVLDGDRLFVTCEEDDALVVVDLKKRAVLRKIAVGQAPRGVAVAPDGKRAFVLCHDEQSLRCLDLDTGKTQSLRLPGWPERLLLHRNAEFPFLLALSSQPGEAAVSLIRTDPQPRILTTNRLRGVTNARGLAGGPGLVSFVLMAHQRPRTHIPTTQVAQGWVFTNAVSVAMVQVALEESRTRIPTTQVAQGRVFPQATKILDDLYRSNADPSDVVLSADLRRAFIACAGADTVLVVRTDKARFVSYGLYREVADLPYSREDLSGTRFYVSARLPTQPNPRRLALSGDGSTLVVSNHLADSLTVIDARALRVRRHIALGGPPPDAARRGQILFNSARMTFQGQFTCASCHPDGGADGLNWDLTRDGIGNFMNTRSLRGVKGTAPYGWYSTSPTLADRITGTLRHLHRHEPQGTEVPDLAAYLRTLPPPRPLPQRESDRAAVARGQALFEGKAGCVHCHQGATFQDGKTHDVGTLTAADTYNRLDTPSLRGVARTAPYLHDGRAATLEEVFTRHNAEHRHGAAHRLTPEELCDLIAYLKSL